MAYLPVNLSTRNPVNPKNANGFMVFMYRRFAV